MNAAPLLILALPIAWFMGLPVVDGARVFAAVLFLKMTLLKSTPTPIDRPLADSAFLRRGLITFLSAYGVFVAVFLILKVYTGRHGIDFAIFTQVIGSFAHPPLWQTTLVAPTNINFLSHHFSPILAGPGLISALGVPAYIAGPLFQGSAALVGAWGLYRLGRAAEMHRSLALLAAATILVTPSIRHSLFWGIHAELLALAFIPWLFLFWLQGRHWWAFGVALAVCTVKESMFLLVIMFALMAIARKDRGATNGALLPYILMAAVGIGGFVGYFLLQPHWLAKEFDHFTKVASVDELLDPGRLWAKIRWLAYLFIPFLAIPLWRRRLMIYLLPVLPSVGIVFVSKFPEMTRLNNYYAACPALLIGIASILSYQSLCKKPGRQVSVGFALLLISLGFSFASHRPAKELLLSSSGSFYTAEDFDRLPHGSVIAATPSAATLLSTSEVYRLDQVTPAMRLDYVIVKKDEEEAIPDFLLASTQACLDSPRWIFRCQTRP